MSRQANSKPHQAVPPFTWLLGSRRDERLHRNKPARDVALHTDYISAFNFWRTQRGVPVEKLAGLDKVCGSEIQALEKLGASADLILRLIIFGIWKIDHHAKAPSLQSQGREIALNSRDWWRDRRKRLQAAATSLNEIFPWYVLRDADNSTAILRLAELLKSLAALIKTEQEKPGKVSIPRLGTVDRRRPKKTIWEIAAPAFCLVKHLEQQCGKPHYAAAARILSQVSKPITARNLYRQIEAYKTSPEAAMLLRYLRY